MSDQKSFTLIELLIVIGILAVLVAAVVVTLNPAQLLAQARDSKRQQDLSALNHALNTITALDQSLFMGTSSIVYTSLPDSTTTCANWNLPSLPSGWQYHCSPTTTLQNTDGNGWIPVNFKTTGVISLSSLPIDPQNTSSTGLYYTYVSGGSFQLASHFESPKYQLTQGSDAMYTVGSNTTLAPFLSGLVGWWKFDEGSGTTTADSSGYGHNGTLLPSTSTPSWVSGKSGYGIGINQSFQRVSVNFPGLSLSVDQSISFWSYLRSFDSINNVLIGWREPTCYGSAFFTPTNGTIQYYSSGPEKNLGSFTVGSWHQVVASKSSGIINFYVDGQQRGSVDNMTIAMNTLLDSMGASCGISGAANAIIDDVRIYNRALSASEISALYNATK
jgi:prepilin-type N-terminal cleavage/methylation domain-containing protein